MQDVCVSFWPENGPEGSYTNDMIAKVTDICSTDPNDPTHCATPADIKVDRAKVQVMYNIPVPGSENADLQKDKYVKGTYWHLTKCWGNVCVNLFFWPVEPFKLAAAAFLWPYMLISARHYPSLPTGTVGGLSPLFPTISNGTLMRPGNNTRTTSYPTPARAGPPTPMVLQPTHSRKPTWRPLTTGYLVKSHLGPRSREARVMAPLSALMGRRAAAQVRA
jgi:hypothetical protein